MKKMVLMIVLAVALGFVALAQAGEIFTFNIFPPVKIIQPDPGLKELTAFSGTWSGTWPGHTPFLLFVEEINEKSATIVYAWGNNLRYKLNSGAVRQKAQVVVRGDEKPRLESVSGEARLTFILLSNGSLDAFWVGRGSPLRAIANRTDGNGGVIK
jgi:hypothetical protein